MKHSEVDLPSIGGVLGDARTERARPTWRKTLLAREAAAKSSSGIKKQTLWQGGGRKARGREGQALRHLYA